MKSSGGKFFVVDKFDNEVILAWTDVPGQPSGDAMMTPADARKLGQALLYMAAEVAADNEEASDDDGWPAV